MLSTIERPPIRESKTVSAPSTAGDHPLLWRAGGVLAFTALIGWAICGRGPLSPFFDVGSGLIAIGGPVALLLAVFGWTGARDSVLTLLVGASATREAQDAAGFFRLGAAFSLACGFLGTLIGLMIMLGSMDDPSTIGPALAMAMLTQFYAVLLAIGCVVAGAIISRRQGSHGLLDKLTRHSVATAGTTAAAGTAMILLAFMIIVVVMAP